MNTETTYLHLAATGSEDTSEYESVFNEDVLVKKDSKIALQSVSINFNPDQIYLDSTNNFFFLAIAGADGFGATNAAGDATSIRGQLTNGQYNATTLMSELTYQLNRTNTYILTTTQSGRVEFNAITDTNNKVNIQLARTADDLNPPATDYTVNGITVDTTPAQNAFTRNAGNVGDYSYAIYNPFWIRSRGSYRIRLPENRIGTIVGLVENIPDSTTVTTLPASDYYLAVENTDGDYTVTYNGTSYIYPGLVPANDDIIIILIGDGKYRISISNAGNVTTVFEEAYTTESYKKYLHGAVSILDPAGTADRFRFTPSGFQLSTIDGIHEVADISELTNPNYISKIGANPPGAQPRLTLTLSNGLRDLLGYQVNTFASQKNPDSFLGVQNLDLISFPNAILVELVNVPLNSYDAVSRRRKNILGFLPGFERTSDTSNYYYVASEMVFINTKLFSDTLINSWRVRITDGDGGLLSIDPGKIAINIVVVSK
jgi:hypothetical protein